MASAPVPRALQMSIKVGRAGISNPRSIREIELEANAPGMTVTMPDKARELVRGLKAMGFTVVLLTNAQQELAEGACKDLGADY